MVKFDNVSVGQRLFIPGVGEHGNVEDISVVGKHRYTVTVRLESGRSVTYRRKQWFAELPLGSEGRLVPPVSQSYQSRRPAATRVPRSHSYTPDLASADAPLDPSLPEPPGSATKHAWTDDPVPSEGGESSSLEDTPSDSTGSDEGASTGEAKTSSSSERTVNVVYEDNQWLVTERNGEVTLVEHFKRKSDALEYVNRLKPGYRLVVYRGDGMVQVDKVV
jgi:hypothetical protein